MEPNVKKLEERLKKLEDVLFGVSNDTRFQVKVRGQVIDVQASSGKPIIISKDGKRWLVTNVTELN